MDIEISKLLDKAWWRSRTIWVQIIGSLILTVIGALTLWLGQLDAAWAVGALMVLGYAKDWITTGLRLGTKHGIIPAKEELKNRQDVGRMEQILLAIGDVEVNEVEDIKKAVSQIRFNKKVEEATEILKIAEAAKATVAGGEAELPKL